MLAVRLYGPHDLRVDQVQTRSVESGQALRELAEEFDAS
jgi:hypothetical protein